MDSLNLNREEGIITENIFDRIRSIKLLDKYTAYKLLDDEWQKIAIDLEIIKTEGFASTKKVDPVMVTKKKGNKETEIQDGWAGRVIPFELIQKNKLRSDKDRIVDMKERLSSISAEYSEVIDSINEDDKEANKDCFNDEKDSFVAAEVAKYVKKLKGQKITDEESFDFKIKHVNDLITEEKELRKTLKIATSELLEKSKAAIENLTDDEVIELLQEKWIEPIINSINKLPVTLIDDFVSSLQKLSKKYKTTLIDVDEDTEKAEKELILLIDELEADEFDTKGLQGFKKLLGGEQNGEKR